ncbi:MAG: hypothetical protein KKB50_06690 [Planctomycetes bacterium]|nr:hypothetical protein [Planctomycetota bacterium]
MPLAAQTLPGDYLVISRSYGTVYSVDPTTGLIRGLMSGLELRDQSGTIRGDGDALSGSFRTSLAIAQDGDFLARFGQGETSFGLASISAAYGHRTVLAGTTEPAWFECGHVIALDDATVLTTADDWYTEPPPGEGRILAYDLELATTTVVTGAGIGDGPALKLPRGLAQLDAQTLLVAETDLQTFPSGAGLFMVDQQTGDRTFLSRLTPWPFTRQVIIDGQPAGEVTLGDDEGGVGPVSNLQARSVTVIDGRIVVGVAIKLLDESYNGGLLEIDPATGDRTLLVGQALVDDGTAQTVVSAVPANWATVPFLDCPIGLLETDIGRLAFTCLFESGSIFEYDLATNELFEIADLATQLDPVFLDGLQLSGLAISRVHFLAGDVNCDGEINGFDIDAFIVALQSTPPDHATYYAVYPDCHVENADCNGDGLINGFDINVFVALLGA